MDISAIRRERSEIISQFGIWTDHNIRLADGIGTIDGAGPSDKLRRIVQLVIDLTHKPLSELRILDLGCLEGMYAVEFACRGARVVAIEGREPNIQKARFAKRVLGLDNLEFALGDVRELGRERFATFDVVLCLGILYHLDVPDVFDFVANIAQVCDRLAVFDTYVSLVPKQRYEFGGREYWGREIVEHAPHESATDRSNKLWASLDNQKSVWLTQNTLLNLLMHSGFTSVYEAHVPVELTKPLDRVTLVAVKGNKTLPLIQRNCPGSLPENMPEKRRCVPSHHQMPFADFRHTLVGAFPRHWKRNAKATLRALGLIRGQKARWEGDERFKW